MKKIFFLGYFYLDNITFDNAIIYDNDIIHLLIDDIIALPFWGIILLSSISSILDTEADFQERQKQRYIPRSSIIDLTYTILPRPNGTPVTQLFVYDKTDPTGSKFFALFSGVGYQITHNNGITGYTGLSVHSINAEREVRMLTSALAINIIEKEGVVILSNGLPIKKEVSLSGRSIRTHLCVKENQ